ncbi:MAG: ABC transporter ATP-binding protein [Oscillospiraceae bacterium]
MQSKQANPMKAKNPGKTLGRLMGYIISEYKWRFLLVLVCILISSLAGVAGSLFIRTLIDDYITPLMGQQNPSFAGLMAAIIQMAIIYLAGVLAGFLYNRIMITISQGIQKKIRDDMFAHMQRLPIRYFDTHAFGDLMSRYTNDTDTLRQMLSQSIPQLLSTAVSVVSIFITMLVLSIPMTLVIIVMLVLMLLVIRKVGGNSAKYFGKQQQSIGQVNGYIEEMMNGQKVIKVFNHEEAAKEQFDELNEELCDSATKANTFANILMPILGNISNLQYALLAIVGGILAVTGVGGLTIGVIASFLQMSKSFSMPIAQASQQFNSIIMALAGAGRIFDFMDEPVEVDDGYVTLVNARYVGDDLAEADGRTGLWAWKHPHGDGTITYTKLSGDVRFFDVDFGYTPDKLVLHDVSLYAHPGEKLAFVGATGAGKTTITNLINRFYDIADGKIRYDDININKIKKSDLRRSLGIVLQDTHLFTGSIMENIRYGRLEASDEEVKAAAFLAGAHGFVERFPQGYDTVLTGDGSEISQGQRQLLAIARAAVADPPVMILDEATSSIDTRTEEIVQKGMDSLMYGRTVFVIAHRLSTVRNSDAIMVLEHGRIIERGSHDELIAQHGRYYQLYTGAFELE